MKTEAPSSYNESPAPPVQSGPADCIPKYSPTKGVIRPPEQVFESPQPQREYLPSVSEYKDELR